MVRKFLPAGWFDRKPPALDETKLLILGAYEVAGDEIPSTLLSQISDADQRVYASIANAASSEATGDGVKQARDRQRPRPQSSSSAQRSAKVVNTKKKPAKAVSKTLTG